jgi:hypothetical protein
MAEAARAVAGELEIDFAGVNILPLLPAARQPS